MTPQEQALVDELFDRLGELVSHHGLEGVVALLDRVESARVDQGALEGRVDVFEETDHVVGAHHGARPAGSSSVVVAVEPDDCVRDSVAAIPPVPFAAAPLPFPVLPQSSRRGQG